MFKTNLNELSASFTESVFGERTADISVLVVADGKLDFVDLPAQFSLTRLCRTLAASSLPGETIRIKTAHRSPLPKGADLREFKFGDPKLPADVAFNFTNYNQLWLFGDEGEKSTFLLTPAEIQLISEFMNLGGGVFATGDHQDLGFALCSQLPRVGSMRKWAFHKPPTPDLKAPDMNGPTRIDSLREGDNQGFQEPDQRDSFPQEIRPKFFIKKNRSEPHPLLANSPVAISILPDHQHEGECIIPDPLNPVEYPDQVGPEVVAISTSAGGLFAPIEVDGPIHPVEPRCYKIIVAYDGHLVKQPLGRVAVDASFHHFLNYNLQCFADDSKEFKVISKYYGNILHWLCPPGLQVNRYLNLLLTLRFSPVLLEELEGLSKDDWEHILFAGRVTHKTIATNLSTAEANLCALAVASILPPKTRDALTDWLYPWRSNARSQKDSNAFFNPDDIARVVLGSAILGMASELPQTFHNVGTALTEHEFQGKSLHSFTREGVKVGAIFLGKAIKESNARLDNFANVLAAFK